MSIKSRLDKLEERDGPTTDEPLLIVTGVPSGEHDDGTAPAVARVAGQWLAREDDEPEAAFLARVGASQRRTGA
jgi:hypothetical protein